MPSDEEYEAFLKALGARIRTMRKERGITLRDLVVVHGYHDTQWRKYERGGGINLRSLLRIAEVLQCPLEDLLAFDQKSRQHP